VLCYSARTPPRRRSAASPPAVRCSVPESRSPLHKGSGTRRRCASLLVALEVHPRSPCRTGKLRSIKRGRSPEPVDRCRHRRVQPGWQAYRPAAIKRATRGSSLARPPRHHRINRLVQRHPAALSPRPQATYRIRSHHQTGGPEDRSLTSHQPCPSNRGKLNNSSSRAASEAEPNNRKAVVRSAVRTPRGRQLGE
jgi:hypothetical protein